MKSLMCSLLVVGLSAVQATVQTPPPPLPEGLQVQPPLFRSGTYVVPIGLSLNYNHKPWTGLTVADFVLLLDKTELPPADVAPDEQTPGRYTLFLQPPAGARDGKPHELRLKVKRPNSKNWATLPFKTSITLPKLIASERVADLPSTLEAATGTYPQRLDRFQQSLESLRRQYAIPGLSGAIVSHGQIIWEKGLGFQDVENQIAATPDTPYRTASITKTFASMLLMKCVENGRLNLDTPISNYTSSISDARVTVRHLFTHTSQSSPPGESYRYSGDRYNVLTPVVESCTGKSFREVLAKDILDRLAMWDSVPGQDMESPSAQTAALFTPDTLQRYNRVIQRLAKPYVIDDSGRPILSAYPPKGIFAAAGLISTVRDLARYDSAIDQHLLLASQTQEQAWTNYVNSKGQKLPYALGWFVQMDGRERLIWHYGQWDTFSGLFLKVPGRNVTLILLANSSRLSSPFNALGAGNVTGSPFAKLFLELFVGSPSDRGSSHSSTVAIDDSSLPIGLR